MLSVDEKSQIQALERTRRSFPCGQGSPKSRPTTRRDPRWGSAGRARLWTGARRHRCWLPRADVGKARPARELVAVRRRTSADRGHGSARCHDPLRTRRLRPGRGDHRPGRWRDPVRLDRRRQTRSRSSVMKIQQHASAQPGAHHHPAHKDPGSPSARSALIRRYVDTVFVDFPIDRCARNADRASGFAAISAGFGEALDDGVALGGFHAREDSLVAAEAFWW